MSFDEGRNNSLDQVVSQDNTKDKDNHNDLLPQPSGQVSTSSPQKDNTRHHQHHRMMIQIRWN